MNVLNPFSLIQSINSFLPAKVHPSRWQLDLNINLIMAHLIRLNGFSTVQGDLTVFEKIMPGSIKRVFYIYGTNGKKRGGHRHRRTWNALICIAGSCRIYSNDGSKEEYFLLDDPESCLILEPQDWHTMDSFSKDNILLVLSNEFYDKADYITEPYRSSPSISQ